VNSIILAPSYTVSKLWLIICQIFASDRGFTLTPSLAVIPYEYRHIPLKTKFFGLISLAEFIGVSSTTFFVNSRSRSLTFTFAICRRPSVCCLSCLSSVCNARAPYSGDCNFRQCFTPFGTLAVCDLSIKILRRLPYENPSVGWLNRKG